MRSRFNSWLKWAPLTLFTLVLLVIAFANQYRPVTLADIPSSVLASVDQANLKFTEQGIDKEIEYETRKTFTTPAGSVMSRISTKLKPLGNGFYLRHDDWRDENGMALLYEERYIIFRNLVSVHTRFREIAPFIHELMGGFGWHEDRVVDQHIEIALGFPGVKSMTLRTTQKRDANTDHKNIGLRDTTYEREVVCTVGDAISGTRIHTSLVEQVNLVNCDAKRSHLDASMMSQYAYIPSVGIFVLLDRNESGADALPNAVNSITKFEVHH